jgi:hypothetical protein
VPKKHDSTSLPQKEQSIKVELERRTSSRRVGAASGGL